MTTSFSSTYNQWRPKPIKCARSPSVGVVPASELAHLWEWSRLGWASPSVGVVPASELTGHRWEEGGPKPMVSHWQGFSPDDHFVRKQTFLLCRNLKKASFCFSWLTTLQITYLKTSLWLTSSSRCQKTKVCMFRASLSPLSPPY